MCLDWLVSLGVSVSLLWLCICNSFISTMVLGSLDLEITFSARIFSRKEQVWFSNSLNKILVLTLISPWPRLYMTISDWFSMTREEGLWPPLQPSSTTKLNGGAEVWVACAVLEQKRMDTTLSVVRLSVLLTISEILENRPLPITFSDGFIVWFFWRRFKNSCLCENTQDTT